MIYELAEGYYGGRRKRRKKEEKEDGVKQGRRKGRMGLEGATTAITPTVLALRRLKQRGCYECEARLGCMVRLSDQPEL